MKIKELRKELGLTLQDLANILGTSNQTVSNWETGKTEPDINSLVKLSKVFSCSLDYLITGRTFDENYVIIGKNDYIRLTENAKELVKILELNKQKK